MANQKNCDTCYYIQNHQEYAKLIAQKRYDATHITPCCYCDRECCYATKEDIDYELKTFGQVF